jgi:histone H3/H4
MKHDPKATKYIEAFLNDIREKMTKKAEEMAQKEKRDTVIVTDVADAYRIVVLGRSETNTSIRAKKGR